MCTERDDDAQLDHVALLDSVLAIQNMFLKAYELGLGTCYMESVQLIGNKPEALKKLGVPDEYEIKVPSSWVTRRIKSALAGETNQTFNG